MAANASNPRQRSTRSTPARGSPQPPYNSDSARKRRKYQPGGLGGGGRFIEFEERARSANRRSNIVARDYAEENPEVVTLASNVRLRRNNNAAYKTTPQPSTQSKKPTYDSAAEAAAAATGQVDGYKPREERSWEEFHPDLDIDATCCIFSADEVDGVLLEGSKDGLGLNASFHSQNASPAANGASPHMFQSTPDGQPVSTPPPKRRPGRPPKNRNRNFELNTIVPGLGSPPTPRVTPLPAQNPREKLNLPKPSFRKVETFRSFETDRTVQINYVDKSMANVGFQESEMYMRPDKSFIRFAETGLEEDTDKNMKAQNEKWHSSGSAPIVCRVEYDMDEQDEKWLDAYNALRKNDQVEAIKPAVFEITMTQIEREWNALEKRIPKPNPKPPQTHRPRSSSAAAVNGETANQGEEQDSKCAVCDDGECENTNAIVFCDGCDLAVHQECYGVPYIPEGQWLCRKCVNLGRSVPTCIFCPNTDGAFKLTNEMRWSHLICAIWIPEVSLGNSTFMEPVMDVAKVPRQRWKLTCYICNQKMGACIQCGSKNCFQAFHVTCARRAKLFLKMKSHHGGPSTLDASVLKAFCDKHAPSEWQRVHDVERSTITAKDYYRRVMKGRRWADSQQSALAILPSHQARTGAADEESSNRNTGNDSAATAAQKKKRLAAQKNIWRLASGAPIVPAVVFDAVESSLQRYAVRKRKEFVAEACRYWTLKREARRGAALLKRLQLQMETFSTSDITRRNFATMGAVGRTRLERRLDMAELLLDDLNTLRRICQETRDRERQKLEQAEVLNEVVNTIYFPISALLRPVMLKAQATMQARLEDRIYNSVPAFSADLCEIFEAAVASEEPDGSWGGSLYDQTRNTPMLNTPALNNQKEVKKVAKRILRSLEPLLQESIRKEAELSGKPFEKELEKIEQLLGRSLTSQAHDANQKEDIMEDVPEKEHNAKIPNGAIHVDGNLSVQQSSSAQEGVQDITTNGSHETEVSEAQPEDSKNFDTEPSETRLNGGDESGQQSTSHQQDQGPTNVPSPVMAGGIPWYLDSFDPSGTKVYEERWSGREVVRGMSEDLSEIDEDELQGLEEGIADQGDKSAPAKKRKRKKGFW
ncbi:MAG: nuA3 HAT complex component nto1 [Alyxoria varia]|nr:MAG: nuA3 HAT complex component nto1 [Alyxoria varia]